MFRLAQTMHRVFCHSATLALTREKIDVNGRSFSVKAEANEASAFVPLSFIDSDLGGKFGVYVDNGNVQAGTNDASALVPLFFSDLGETCDAHPDSFAVEAGTERCIRNWSSC